MSDILQRIEVGYDLSHVAPGVHRGRVPLDGYWRACALQFGTATQVLSADPDFRAAARLAKGRTVIEDGLVLANLFLIVAGFLPMRPPGAIVEFGSYRGGSAFFLARLAQRFLPGTKVYAFDTFAGMPETDAVDAHKAGDFGDVNIAEIRVAAAMAGLTNLVLVQGRFEDTAVETLRSVGAVSFAHIDCDIQSAIATSYDALRPHLVPGAYIVFDDPLAASCLGAFEAVEDLLVRRDGLHAEQVYPQLVFRQPPAAD